LEAAGGGITQNPQKPLMQFGVDSMTRLTRSVPMRDQGELFWHELITRVASELLSSVLHNPNFWIHGWNSERLTVVIK
jgi:hypothetical protein